MTEAAINPVIGDVMLMAERHGLFSRNVDVGEIRRLVDDPSEIAEGGGDKQRPKDANARNSISAAVKDLGH